MRSLWLASLELIGIIGCKGFQRHHCLVRNETMLATVSLDFWFAEVVGAVEVIDFLGVFTQLIAVSADLLVWAKLLFILSALDVHFVLF